VHGYVITPGDRIRYLAELTSGDPVLVVNADGQARTLAVGRNKIERRPMVRIDAKTNDGQLISAIVQHAETIRLVSPDGKPSSITTLNRGDQVLASVTQPSGRHFGRPVSETIQER
ncbi:MAG TPA: 3-dehydroquinate synthase II, partial [Halothiobacillaceae bacterium]|nr:3-dehydroquinate synthase II [Halothiobacillaceae bacterium]